MNHETTLDQRGREYGHVQVQAIMFEQMANAMQEGPGWKKMTSVQKQSAMMIVLKLSRLAAGNPRNIDGWHDIAGYATLAEQQLQPVPLAMKIEPGGGRYPRDESA